MLFQALCGARAAVPLLGSEERMVINLQDEVIKPNTVKRVVGKGLPNPKDPSRRGDLIVSFEILFPERLSPTTRDLFRSHLPGKWAGNSKQTQNYYSLWCFMNRHKAKEINTYLY